MDDDTISPELGAMGTVDQVMNSRKEFIDKMIQNISQMGRDLTRVRTVLVVTEQTAREMGLIEQADRLKSEIEYLDQKYF